MTGLIETVALTGSTNADLLSRVAEGAPEGLWLRAERQEGGRGRQGRVWQSPPGNLYCSTIVRLRHDDPLVSTLALIAGLAVHDVVQPLLAGQVAAQLKWPNDVMVDGAKLAGVLLERSGDAVVVGIGLNIAATPPVTDRKVCHLHGLGVPTAYDAAMAVQDLSKAFARRLHGWRTAPLSHSLSEWTTRAFPLGTIMGCTARDGSRFEGGFAGLSADGALLLRGLDGSLQTVHAGDVDLI